MSTLPRPHPIKRAPTLKRRGHLKRHAPTIPRASWLHRGNVGVEAQGARICAVRDFRDLRQVRATA